MTVRCRNLDLLQLLWERTSKEGRNKEKKREKWRKKRERKERERKREKKKKMKKNDERIGKRITEDVRRLLDFNVMSTAQGHLRTSQFCHKQMHTLKLLS